MRIEAFWAKGYRSLRDVRLDSLGPFNVLYGPNGSGKSNLLAAIRAWLQLIPIAFETELLRTNGEPNLPPQQAMERWRGHRALYAEDAPLHPRDFTAGASRKRIKLGGTLVDVSSEIERVTITFEVDADHRARVALLTDLTIDGLQMEHGEQLTDAQRARLAAFEKLSIDRKLSAVPADRMPRAETASQRPPDGVDPLAWYFERGQLKDALFAAQNATSASTVRALEKFRSLMQGPPLHRPPFRCVEDPHSGVRDLREWLPPPRDAHDVSLDLAGLGVAQIYWIVAQAMLSRADIITIEEPEAHLHAPTTGRMLREILQRLVSEQHIQQLFIATHSNLFDLDPAGYFDVSLDAEGATVIERRPLRDLDRHFYEPGPTLHALEELMSVVPADKVMFRRPDGAPVTAAEMAEMLRAADPIALDYLRTLHGATVDVVGLRSRKAPRT